MYSYMFVWNKLQHILDHWPSHFFKEYFVWLRMTDDGHIPEMRVWSILLVNPILKWCIHPKGSLFLYFNYFVSVTAGGSEVLEGTCSQVLRSTLVLVALWKHRHFSRLKVIEIVILLVYYTISSGFKIFRYFWGTIYQICTILYLPKDNRWRFNTRNAHMVHIVNQRYIQLKLRFIFVFQISL